MEFQILDSNIFQNCDGNALSFYEVLEDMPKSILFLDKKISSEWIWRNVCYQNVTDTCFQRTEIVSDLSKEQELEFFVQVQRFEVLNSIFGFVETERSGRLFSYQKIDLQELENLKHISNPFLVLDKCKSYQACLQENFGYFRMPGEYGVDTVLDHLGGKMQVSSSCVYLDSVIDKVSDFDKQR